MSIGLLQVKVEPIPTVCPHGHSGTTEPLPGNLASKKKKKEEDDDDNDDDNIPEICLFAPNLATNSGKESPRSAMVLYAVRTHSRTQPSPHCSSRRQQ